MDSLLPGWLRAWRCHCGARHDALWPTCPYTNQPRDDR